MEFKFNKEETYLNYIDVDDLGNVAIEGFSDKDNVYYYLVISTIMGTSSVFQYGPTTKDDRQQFNIASSLMTFDFNDKKLQKTITMFLSKMTDATIISKEEALSYCVDIKEYLR